MKQIKSFQIDHTVLLPGLYVSRVDGDCVTYDLRCKKPNKEPVMSTGAMHTLEHLIATFVRSSQYENSVVYFGPMGCRTGFYLILRDDVSKPEAIALVKDALAFCAAFDDAIPGASKRECGNWRDHDLLGARAEAAAMCAVLKNWGEENLTYPE
ncbi:MAG: S-ribosylhomocysteine lyase [Clostridia bacterium]|nr:S-ribosylhomocysteine lyase [Clostridia bacterium]